MITRRQLLEGFTAGLAVCCVGPRAAQALGGPLPPLDEPAPDFSLDGVPGPRSLGDFSGRWLVLYFYPRDFTEGCTIEARGFQRDLETFHAAGAEVVGISADSADSHAEFCGSEALAYPLLSDPGGAVSRRYGSWMAPFSQRHTFLIDPQGMLRQLWVGVRPLGHSQEVLAALRERQLRS
ncbi:peroxiredoxin [Cyanobium sp.]|nr:peroxiredoxin [Cyanobium sp.]